MKDEQRRLGNAVLRDRKCIKMTISHYDTVKGFRQANRIFMNGGFGSMALGLKREQTLFGGSKVWRSEDNPNVHSIVTRCPPFLQSNAHGLGPKEFMHHNFESLDSNILNQVAWQYSHQTC